MTPEEREKLVWDMAHKIAAMPEYHLTVDVARAALDIAQAAFATEIEAAYKEGWYENNVTDDFRVTFEKDWKNSATFAAILASIPEKKDD